MSSPTAQSEGPAGERTSARLYLKEYRKRLGFTLKEAADRMELSFSAIQKWETGTTSPAIDNLLRLAEVYDVHPSALFLDPQGVGALSGVDFVMIPASKGQYPVLISCKSLHPNAQGPSGTNEEPDSRQDSQHLIRCLKILQTMPFEWVEHWLSLGELSQPRTPTSTK